MMPPPYKSPPMNAQPPQTQIMSSPTAHQINQSPHYGVPTENGTTSEDSDGKCFRIENRIFNENDYETSDKIFQTNLCVSYDQSMCFFHFETFQSNYKMVFLLHIHSH